ncbi:hypothetical protein GGX14DRAFT_403311 [Mycena pura]|uniref:Uncharacterized protein n=1 Tax=Mycena pura TaxID=153505 RepID=A0AAD6UWR7_9AGAR|nr:hypothetical protein GGX14DRAFT_403311 [Mycena pura]
MDASMKVTSQGPGHIHDIHQWMLPYPVDAPMSMAPYPHGKDKPREVWLEVAQTSATAPKIMNKLLGHQNAQKNVVPKILAAFYVKIISPSPSTTRTVAVPSGFLPLTIRAVYSRPCAPYGRVYRTAVPVYGTAASPNLTALPVYVESTMESTINEKIRVLHWKGYKDGPSFKDSEVDKSVIEIIMSHPLRTNLSERSTELIHALPGTLVQQTHARRQPKRVQKADDEATVNALCVRVVALRPKVARLRILQAQSELVERCAVVAVCTAADTIINTEQLEPGGEGRVNKQPEAGRLTCLALVTSDILGSLKHSS